MPVALPLTSQLISDFVARLARLGEQAEAAALGMVLALSVVLVGWVISTLLAWLLRTALRSLRFNEAVRGLMGLPAAEHEPARLVGWVAHWVLFTASLLLALETVGLQLGLSVGSLLGQIVPRILAAGFLFVIGSLVAVIFGALARRFFASAGLGSGRLRGQIVTGLLTGLAALLALEQLGFAAQFVMTLALLIVGAVSIAFGLAFGLGCRDLARDFVVEYLRTMGDREEGPHDS